jgi:hypothetical protein
MTRTRWLSELLVAICLSGVLTAQKSSPRYLVLDSWDTKIGKQLIQAADDGYQVTALANQVVDQRRTPASSNGYGIFHSEKALILLERAPASNVPLLYAVCSANEPRTFESKMKELGKVGWKILPQFALVSRNWDWDATVGAYTAIFIKSSGRFDYRLLSPMDHSFEQALDELQKAGFRFVTLLGDDLLLEKVSAIEPAASSAPEPRYESVRENKLGVLEAGLNASAQRGFRLLEAQSGVTGELISVLLERPPIPTINAPQTEYKVLFGNDDSKLEGALNELSMKGFHICPAGVVSFTPVLIKDRKTLFQAPDTAVFIMERIAGSKSQPEYQVRSVQRKKKLRAEFTQIEQEGSGFVAFISLRDKDLLITTKSVN